MNKKIPISLAIAIAIVAMTITFSITMIVSMKRFDATVSSVKEKEAMYGKIAELDKSVRGSYYGDIDDHQLFDTLGAGYLAGIGDKYARYYTSAQYATYLNQLAGKLMGIGVEVVKDPTGYVRIIKVYADSPAAEIGIAEGSYLTSIDDKDVKALSLDAVRTALTGEEGTIVKVGLLAADLVTTSTQELSRRIYTVPSVSSQLVKNTGYIRITAFNQNTPSEFEQQLNSQLSAGITGLVLDVRGNASSDIDNMVRVLDLLCPRTASIGSMVYRSGDSVSLGHTTEDSSLDLPIVVVTNAGTSGASELFCVSLRDLAGARLVGVRTAGKGSVQAIVEQTDGSALEFTVARIVPANSESSFDGIGVAPDFEIALSAADESIAYMLTTATDPQLLRAFEMVDTLTGASTAAGQPAEDGQQPAEGENTEGGQPAQDAGADSTAEEAGSTAEESSSDSTEEENASTDE